MKKALMVLTLTLLAFPTLADSPSFKHYCDVVEVTQTGDLYEIECENDFVILATEVPDAEPPQEVTWFVRGTVERFEVAGSSFNVLVAESVVPALFVVAAGEE